MTLTPDDLPPADGEASQIFCGCTSGEFKVILTAAEVVAVCARCGADNGRWPRGAASAGPGLGGLLPGARDTMPQVHAAWVEPDPPDVADLPMTGTAYGAGGPPPLPAYSSGVCNVYLDGGPYDGQVTWLLVPTGNFTIAGLGGQYLPTSQIRDQRVVYQWESYGG